MVKHKNDPRKAMILSKAGKIIARRTMRAVVKTRIITRATFSVPSVAVAIPVLIPQRISRVATRGRAL